MSVEYWDPKTLFGLLLSQISDFTEQYMRSPLFLLWLRYSIQLENLFSHWFARLQSIQPPVRCSTRHAAR